MLNDKDLQKLYRYGYSLSKDSETARDLVQATYLSYLKAAKKIEIQKPLHYAMRSLKHEYLRLIANDRIHTPLEDELVELHEGEDLEGLTIDRQDVQAVLRFCTAEEREILYLWAYEGQSYQEIADFLELSRGALLGKIHRLKIRLREKFGEGHVQ